MVEALDAGWGDPSRLYHSGMAGRAALEDARDRVAASLGARSREVVFTSGATESIATVCRGVADRGDTQVVPAVEHSAVRSSAAAAGRVVEVPVDGTGRVDPDELVAAIGPTTALVHLQWANHEVGTTQDLAPVAAHCRDRGVLLHVDAAQAVGHLPCAFRDLGVDLLSVSGHKLGGPPGTGVLLIRRGLRLDGLLLGGDQERARRAGLENTPGAVGLAAALEEAAASLDVEAGAAARRTGRLRDALTAIDGVTAYGHPTERVPHIVCVGIRDVEPQAVLFGLDRRGVEAHAGSACASADLLPSPVLAAMGVDAHRSLRLSVGWSTTDDDVDAAVAAVPEVVAELRALRG